MTRVLLLTTGTPDTEKFPAAIECAGHECRTIRYAIKPDIADRVALVEAAVDLAPDFIVYLGLFPHGPTPGETPGALGIAALTALKKIAPLVHIVSDAAEPGWWPALEYYDQARIFDASISIDGAIGTPFDNCKRSATLLTPVPFDLFSPMDWFQRPIPFGFAGSLSYRERNIVIRDLLASGRFVTMPSDPASRPYRKVCEWMSMVRVCLNHSGSASGTPQVKGRVLEAAAAQSILVESRGSAARHWFEPGSFLEYSDAEEALDALFWVNTHDSEARAMRDKLVQQVFENHHPKDFWQKTFQLASAR